MSRTVYFDYLRVFATFAVMILHLSAQNWFITDVNEAAWQLFNFYDSIVRWGVPVFVMISGALFLPRDLPVNRIYTKYLPRLVTAFIFWAAIYALFSEGSLMHRLMLVVKGHYHMWFIFMIAGLYICIPLIKPIISEKKRAKYYLVLAFLFCFLIPTTFTLIKDFGSDAVKKAASVVQGNISNMNMHIVLGYAGYFVLGHMINRANLNKQWRMWIYGLGILGFAATIGLDLIVALKTQKCCSNYYGNLNVNILFEAVAVFTWFKHRKYDHPRWNGFVKKLSKYSFGAYLVHALLIEQLNLRLGLNTLSFHPAISVPCIAVIIFALSFSLSAIINHIPCLNKYIV